MYKLLILIFISLCLTACEPTTQSKTVCDKAGCAYVLTKISKEPFYQPDDWIGGLSRTIVSRKRDGDKSTCQGEGLPL